jgi:hypothetical protein
VERIGSRCARYTDGEELTGQVRSHELAVVILGSGQVATESVGESWQRCRNGNGLSIRLRTKFRVALSASFIARERSRFRGKGRLMRG